MYERIVVVGDFNLHIMGTEYNLLQGNEICKQLLFFCQLYNLSLKNNVINFLGRTLDLVLSDIDDMKVVEEADALVNVDQYHPALLIEWRVVGGRGEWGRSCDRPVFNFNKANFLNIYRDIATCDWSHIFRTNDVNLAVDLFHKKLNDILKLHVPYKKPSKLNHPVWFSIELKKLLKNKEKFRKLYKRFNMPHHYNQFSQLRLQAKIQLKNDFNVYIRNIESELKSNPKSFWGVIRRLRMSDKAPTTMRWADKEYEGGAQITEALAEYFSSVYEQNNSDLDTLFRQALCSPVMDNVNTLFISHITEQEVLCALKQLKSKRSVGPDNIPPYILKGCAECIVKPLKYIFNLSLKNNCFPDFWKVAKVVAVPKKGDRYDITNHRPIALVSSPAKVFECILYNRLLEHVKHFIAPSQHGFYPGRSINSNLLNFSQYTINMIDQNIQVDCIYTDFEKAFDKVLHLSLLSKLHYYGLSDNTIHFFTSYLHKRKQFVTYEGFNSVEFEVYSGVPQGSNLGPLLFLIFINDITNCIKNSNLLMYADDLKIYKRVGGISDCLQLQADIDALVHWSMSNLKFNVSKCAVVSYTRKTGSGVLNFDYRMNNIHLTRKLTIKDLGVVFDSKFSFSEHVLSISKAAYSLLGFIQRTSSFLQNFSSIKLLFFSLIRPRLEFASVVWYPHHAYLSDIIESIQRKFLRFLYFKIFGFYTFAIPYTELLDMFNMTRLTDRRKLQCLCYLHKLVSGALDDSNLLGQLDFCVPRHSSRISLIFTPRFSRTNLGYHSPLNTMCRLCNTYQIDIFRHNLKSYKFYLLERIENNYHI